MNGERFREIRKGLLHRGKPITVLQWARALGYVGTAKTVRKQIARYESGERPIPLWISRLAEMYERHGVPAAYFEDPPPRADEHNAQE